jgi:regulator of protease activity HflC (stomatin/prohibitin superfamily)
MYRMLLLCLAAVALSGCAVINQGEVGVRRVWGKLTPQTLGPGLVFYEAVSTDIIRVPTRTVKLRVEHSLPSKEGLTGSSAPTGAGGSDQSNQKFVIPSESRPY